MGVDFGGIFAEMVKVVKFGCRGLDFSKKRRGKKDNSLTGIIPDKLTRCDCVGKFSEVFEPRGLAVPITCGMKLDITVRCTGLAIVSLKCI